jgi:hypothetical protein
MVRKKTTLRKTKDKKHLKSVVKKLFIYLAIIVAFFVVVLLVFRWDSSKATNEYQVSLGNDLYLNLDTSLPSGTNDVRFYVIKKNSTTSRAYKFGVSGAHGEWDLLPGLVKRYNDYWGSNATGEEMLERHYAMLKAIGIKWIRIDQSWERIEPRIGEFEFANIDKIVAAAKRNDLKIMMSLSYTPRWQTKQCTSNATPVHFLSPIDTNLDGSQYYNRFVQKMVERYKPGGSFNPNGNYGISYWQIWNEPDLGFWTDCETGANGYIQPKYVALHKSAYSVIKTEDPEAFVLLAGLSHMKPVSALTNI